MARIIHLLVAGALAFPGAALAQPTSLTTTTFNLDGEAPKTCVLRSPDEATLSVGEMVDPTSGELTRTLASNASDQSTTIENSWCNTASTITVVATPMVAQNFIGLPPPGFTKAINYKATVSGWATSNAVFVTSGDEAGFQHSNTPGSQTLTTPNTATITIAIGNLASPSAGDFLVADKDYSGSVTLTLTPNP
jgi:hypothetical protein